MSRKNSFRKKFSTKILEQWGLKGPIVCSRRLQPSAEARKKPPVGGLNFLVVLKLDLSKPPTSHPELRAPPAPSPALHCFTFSTSSYQESLLLSALLLPLPLALLAVELVFYYGTRWQQWCYSEVTKSQADSSRPPAQTVVAKHLWWQPGAGGVMAHCGLNYSEIYLDKYFL